MYKTLISPSDAKSLLVHGEVLIFDCSFDLSDPAEGELVYREGHIPGARYMHLDNDLSAPPSGSNGRHPLPDKNLLAEVLRLQGLKRGTQVIAYDNAGGAYAARLWWLLRWLGHEAVAVLDGGFRAWCDAGGEIESGAPHLAAPGQFEPGAPLVGGTVDADAVLNNISAPQFVVVDARSAQRFAGTAQAFDPVPGHIPGAINRPFADNLDAKGRFKPTGTLAAEFNQLLAGRKPSEVVLQCGSGVTACHNALAMEIAGLNGARLYPGSWSEWIADPSRPVATGN